MQKVPQGYVMKSRDVMITGFQFSAALTLFFFFFFWELIRKSLFQIKCGLSSEAQGCVLLVKCRCESP